MIHIVMMIIIIFKNKLSELLLLLYDFYIGCYLSDLIRQNMIQIMNFKNKNFNVV
jgi:hypothetical protein